MALQIWLPLDGNLENQGLANIEIVNNGTTISDNGKIGKCYSFNGSNNYLRFKYPMSNLINNWSFCCWVKFNQNKTETLISSRKSAGYGMSIFHIGGQLRFDNGTDSTQSQQTFSSTISLNIWQHIAIIQDQTTRKLYINGILVNTINAMSIVSGNTAQYILVGASSTSDSTPSANYLNGYLNDLRIYDHALSAREIKELAKGLILHYKLSKPMPNILKNTGINTAYSTSDYDNGTWGGTSGGNGTFSIVEDLTVPVGRYSWNILNNTSGNRDYDQGKIPFKVNQIYTASWWAKGNGKILFRIWDSTSGVARITDQTNNLTSEWTFYSKTFTATQIMQDNLCRYKVGVTGSANIYICGMKLEEGEKATAWIPNESDSLYSGMGYNFNIEPDCSGYKRDGIITGTITRNVDTPRYRTCNNIINNSSYIKIDNLQTSGFSNSYSFSWWGKISSFSGRMFWGFSNGVRLNGVYNGNLWNTGDGSNNPLYVPGTTTQIKVPSVNTWHYFVMTGDGTNCKLYLDGEYYGIAKTYKSISGTTIYINGWDNGTSYSGQIYISDFRIYCTTLSADDIKALYEDAGYVDKNGNFHAYEYIEI